MAPSPHTAEGCSWEKITNLRSFDFPSLQKSPRFLALKQANFTLPADRGWNRERNLLAWAVPVVPCRRQCSETPIPPGSALT